MIKKLITKWKRLKLAKIKVRPILIIEGGDGTGKGTQLDLLHKYLKEQGIDSRFTREPGGTVIGEKIRELILDKDHMEMDDLTEAYLYASSRAQHVMELFKDVMNTETMLIVDRFYLSSIVYQGYARGQSVKLIKQLNKPILDNIGHENMVHFVLTLSAEEGIRRKRNQKELDRLELAGSTFHDKVREGYGKELKKNEFGNYYEIDANGSIDEVHQRIVNTLKKLKIV